MAECSERRLPQGHLVYAAGAGEAAVHTVRNYGTTIVCHALDLTAKPAGIGAGARPGREAGPRHRRVKWAFRPRASAPRASRSPTRPVSTRLAFDLATPVIAA